MSNFSIDPQRTALVAIDLQSLLMRHSTAPHPVAEVVKANRQIAEALRARGGLIVWVRVDLNEILSLPVDQPSPFTGQPMPPDLSQIAPSAGFQDGDLLITKHHWGAFAKTALEEQLRRRGIDTVVLTGVSTNFGVESTLRQGTGLGFAFIVAEDACSAQDGEEHRFAFEKTFPRLARVRTAGEVIKALV
jgi:nicotinamidase-related amidase